MDVKDLRTESALSERSSDGNTNYAQSGPTYQSTEKNKSYHEIGSNTNIKVDIQTTRPCAVIGPDRIITQTHPITDPYAKRGHVEPWQFTRPPEYPCKPQIEYHLPRNISPRQTFQENMQRVMVPPRHSALKLAVDHHVPEKSAASSKPVSKVTMTMEAKYCEVPYITNTMSEQKSVRNSELTSNNVNPALIRGAPHMWPHGAVNIQPNRPYGAPEYYQYPEFSNCPPQMQSSMIRPHGTHEDAAPMYSDPYYRGSARFEPYPNMKDRYSQPRFEYVSNYTNPYTTPHFSTHKLPSGAIAQHGYSNYPQVPIKYFEKMRDPMRDSYQRPTNPNMQFLSQGMPPSYNSIPGNCLPSKLYPCPDGAVNPANNTKMPYDSSKSYVNLQPKHYPPPEGYYLNDMSRVHHMKAQMPIPNFPSVNVHPMHPYPFYRKDSVPMKHFDYSSQFKHMEPPYQNHLARVPSHFSPNIISPSESTASNETNHSFAISPEDCGYVSQSSTASIRSTDSGHLYNRYGYMNRVSPVTSRAQPDSKSSHNKDKKDISVRQFLQMWSEGDDEPSDENHMINRIDNQPIRNDAQFEVVNNHEQLYVLGLVNVPSEELDKYNHIQKVSKLPDNIKGYTSIDLLNQFEEVIESSNLSNFTLKSTESKETKVTNKTNIHAVPAMIPNRPLSPLDVEAKISQSVIHKEVGCNFEIRPCSPKMLNVEVASPIQSVIDERVIEKVSNPLANTKTNCIGVKHQDRRRSFNRDDNSNIPSCKMAKTQYSNDIILETDKSSYSIQDLESNSGVCLASLPHLDNEIELTFPEVNQQFINDNKVKSTKIVTDTNQSVHNANQSNSYVPSEVDSTKIGDSTNYPYSPVGLEFAKLSKYRKNKQSGADSIIQQVIRTDSVIIKNPENIYSSNNRQEKILNENVLSMPVDVSRGTAKSSSSVSINIDENITDYEKGNHDPMSQNVATSFATSNTGNGEETIPFDKQLVATEIFANDTKPDTIPITGQLPSLIADVTETDNEIKVDYNTDSQKETIVTSDSIVKSIDQLECLTDSSFHKTNNDCNLDGVFNDPESTFQFTKEDTVDKTIGEFDENEKVNKDDTKDNQLLSGIGLNSKTQFENSSTEDVTKAENRFVSAKLNDSSILLNIDEIDSAPNMEKIDDEIQFEISTENNKINEEVINITSAENPRKTLDTISKHPKPENEEATGISLFSQHSSELVENNLKITEADYLLEDSTNKITPNVNSVYATSVSQNDSEVIIEENRVSGSESIVDTYNSAEIVVNSSPRTELKKEITSPEHFVCETLSSEIKAVNLPSKVSDVEDSSVDQLYKDECSDRTTDNKENNCSNNIKTSEEISAGMSVCEEIIKTDIDESNETLEQISLFIKNSQENSDYENSFSERTEKKSSENHSSNISEESSCSTDLLNDTNLKDKNDEDETVSIKGSVDYSDDMLPEQQGEKETEHVSIFISKEPQDNVITETVLSETNTEYSKNIQKQQNEKSSHFEQSQEMPQNLAQPVSELTKEDGIKELSDGHHEPIDNFCKVEDSEENRDFVTCSSENPTTDKVLKETVDQVTDISEILCSNVEYSEETSNGIPMSTDNLEMANEKVIKNDRFSSNDSLNNDLDDNVHKKISMDKLHEEIKMPQDDLHKIECNEKDDWNQDTTCLLAENPNTQDGSNKYELKMKTMFYKKMFSWIFQSLECPQLHNYYDVGNTAISQVQSAEILEQSLDENEGENINLSIQNEHVTSFGIENREINFGQEIDTKECIGHLNNDTITPPIDINTEIDSKEASLILENENDSPKERENCIIDQIKHPQTETETVLTFHSIDEHYSDKEPNLDLKNTFEKEQNYNMCSMPRAKLKRSFSDSDISVRKSEEIKEPIHETQFLKRKRMEDQEGTSGTYRVTNSYNFIQNRRNSVSSVYHDEQYSLCILIDDNCIITQTDNEEGVCLATIQEDVEDDVFVYNNDDIIATDNVDGETEETLKCCNLVDDVLQTIQIDNVVHEPTEDWVDDVACVETVVSDDIDEEDTELYVQGCYKAPHDEMLNRECSPEALCMNEHTNKIRDIYGDEMCNDDYNLINTFYTMPHMNVNKTLIGKESPHYQDSPQNEDESLENILTTNTSHYGYLNCNELNANLNYSTDEELQASVEDNIINEENIEINESTKVVSGNESEKEDIDSKRTDNFRDSSELSFENNVDVVTGVKELQYKSTSSSPEVTSTTTEEKKSTILLKITNYNGSRISEVNSEDNNDTKKIRCKLTEKNDYLSSKSEFRSSRPLITKAAQKYIPPLHETNNNLKVKLFLPQQSLIKLKQLKVSKDEPKITLQKQNVYLADKSIKPNLKKVKPLFEDVLKSIDEMQYKKQRDKKSKKLIPKMIIKKTENGSHYMSTTDTSEPFNPDLTGMKWQPWVFIEKNIFIDKMAMRGKKRAMFCRRKNAYVLTENFRKYKSVGSTKFVIRNSTIDSNSTPGPLKCTIKLKTY